MREHNPRRWSRLRVRGLVLLSALVVAATGWYMARVRPQLRAIAAIDAAGGHYLTSRDLNQRITLLERTGIADWLDHVVAAKMLHPVVSVTIVDIDEATCNAIAELPEVRNAALTGQMNFDRSIPCLAAWTHLQTLDIDRSPITGHTLDRLAGCADLRTVILHDCDRVDDEGLAKLAKINAITHLTLSGCHAFTDLEVLAALPALESLRLDGCDQLTNHALTFVQQINGLKFLSAEETWTDDYVIAQWADMPRLRRLDLAGCWNLNGSGFVASSGFPHLESLDVSRCAIDDQSLASLAALKQLQRLSIDSDEISAAGLLRFQQQLPGCKVDFLRH